MKKVTRADLEAHIRKARGLISEHGWMVQGVGPGPDDPPYTYSVGFSKTLGHPEVYLVGLPFELSVSLINTVGRRIKDGTRFEAACYSAVIAEQFPIAFMPIERKSVISHSAAGRNILGSVFSGVQMIIPDAAGLFPWEEGCGRDIASIQMALLDVVGDPPAKDVRVPRPN